MLLRDRLTRSLEGARPWKAVIFGNSVILSLFLWHMTAYLIAIIALWPLGLGQESGSTARWWLERPVWALVPGLLLSVIVVLVARFERPPRARSTRGRARHVAAVRPG